MKYISLANLFTMQNNNNKRSTFAEVTIVVVVERAYGAGIMSNKVMKIYN